MGILLSYRIAGEINELKHIIQCFAHNRHSGRMKSSGFSPRNDIVPQGTVMPEAFLVFTDDDGVWCVEARGGAAPPGCSATPAPSRELSSPQVSVVLQLRDPHV